MIGVTTAAVQKWESGRTPVNLAILQMLADIFGTEPAALLFAPLEQDQLEQMRAAFRVIAGSDAKAVDEWLALGARLIQKSEPSLDEKIPPPRAPTGRRKRLPQ